MKRILGLDLGSTSIGWAYVLEGEWVKVMDSILGGIPDLSMLTRYLFNPTYLLNDTSGNIIVKMKKKPSFFGSDFELLKVGEMDSDDDRIILGLMMMVLLERRRG